MANSIAQPQPASCHPKGDFVLSYTSDKQPGRFEVEHCSPNDAKRMTMWTQLFLWLLLNVLDRIITIIVLLYLQSHLFVLIFDKMKTGPCPTVFSGEPKQPPLLSGQLSRS